MSAARSAGASGHVRTVVLEHSPVRRAVFLGLLPTDHFDIRFPVDEQNWSSAFESFPAQVVLVWQEDPARFRATCARVRALPDAVDMPLVLVSRRRPGVDRSQGVDAGADGLLLLPAGAPEAREEIDYAIAARKGAPKPKPRSGNAEGAIPAAAPVAATAAPASASPASASGNWGEFREQVQKLHATLDRATHYEILGIDRAASVKDVTIAFHSAAIAFHPDRFVRLAEPDLRRMIYEIFKRMSKAFSVLTDPRQRSAYDQSLPGAPAKAEASSTARSAGRPDRARTPQGRKFLDMAERSLQQGKFRAARLQLAIAMQMEPGNAVLQKMIRDVDRNIAENPETE